MIAPEIGVLDAEKPVHTHEELQGEHLGPTAVRTAPESPETAANPMSHDGFRTEDDEYISGYKLFAALVGIISVFFIVLLDFNIISTSTVGWYGGAYRLSSAALQPLTGKLYTYLSAKRTFLFFVAIFEIGSSLCAVSTSSTFFILGRAVAGLGTSGLENGALTLISGAVPLHKRPFYTGIVFAVGQIGIVVGPLIGGVFTQYVTWRWCFYINLIIGAISVVFLFFTHIPDETLKPPFSFALLRSIGPNLDLTGCALFAPATVISPTVIGLFAGSGTTTILFYLWECRVGEAALIPFHLVKRRIVWTSTVQNSFLLITNFVGATYVPIYFQAVKGVPNTIRFTRDGTTNSKYSHYLKIYPFQRAISAVISVQNAVTPAQSPVAITFLVFVQNLLAAIFTIVGNAIFTQTLIRQVSIPAPSVSPEAALAAGGGAEAVRALLPLGSPELGGLLLAYSKSVNAVFYLLVAVAVVCFTPAWGMGWVDIRKKAPEMDGRIRRYHGYSQ
ncbi:major facilitator superfamily transporter [Xylaria sp. FL0064]|nr:major facilitator superfamily transporter [Xylaria sp. FL0064]